MSVIRIIIGNAIEKSKPFFKSLPSASVIKPISVGPVVQPTSPAMARNANIAVEIPVIIFCAQADCTGPHC